MPVAVYSDHFSHVSVMRKVLLRMTSWMHYSTRIINCDEGRLTLSLTCFCLRLNHTYLLLAKGAGNETDRQLHQSLCT